MDGDRELLEYAAKAAGVDKYKWVLFAEQHDDDFAGSTPIVWNPLEDDGDALRLLVDLGLEVRPYFYYDESRQKAATVRRYGGGKREDLVACFPTYAESFCKYDPRAATRRAIVRAAAEIGKAMR